MFSAHIPSQAELKTFSCLSFLFPALGESGLTLRRDEDGDGTSHNCFFILRGCEEMVTSHIVYIAASQERRGDQLDVRRPTGVVCFNIKIGSNKMPCSVR